MELPFLQDDEATKTNEGNLDNTLTDFISNVPNNISNQISMHVNQNQPNFQDVKNIINSPIGEQDIIYPDSEINQTTSILNGKNFIESSNKRKADSFRVKAFGELLSNLNVEVDSVLEFASNHLRNLFNKEGQ